MTLLWVGVIQTGSEDVILETAPSTGGSNPVQVAESGDHKKIVFMGESNRPNLIFTSPPYFDAEQYG